ncbi:MAG: DUF1294 domain-containing protein [Oscillospiraceae bacterium]
MEHPVDVVLGTCLIVLNLTAFFTYGWDEFRAKGGEWRVPEAHPAGAGFLGGGVGALLRGCECFITRPAKPSLAEASRRLCCCGCCCWRDWQFKWECCRFDGDFFEKIYKILRFC